MDEFDAAREMALRYLDHRPRTRREVELRLQRGGYDAAVVDAVTAALEQAGIIDDARYAAQWVRERSEHRQHGRTRLQADLRQRGVHQEAIDAALEPLDQAVEASAAEDLLRRRLGSDDPGDPAVRRRVAAYLARRGYTWEAIEAAWRAVAGD